MSHTPEREFPDDLSQIYSRLNQLDVEQFYTGYQWWVTHRRITALQEEIDTVRLQIHENAYYMQHARPPAVALATLARLQANGVDDLDLLDRMLEQGEEWLDLIMQRLDYCEQLGFIQGNYTQWCEHALEGAYDWIDSMRDAEVDTSSPPEAPADIETTEELLLRKLTSGEDGEVSMPEPPTAEKQLAGEAPFESISAQVAQVSPPEEVSLVEPGAEVPEPTTAIEQAMEEQQIETVKASEAAHIAEENGPSAASFERAGERQAVELALQPETISSTEVEVDTDLASVSTEQDHEQLLVESGETPEETLPTDEDAAELVAVSIEHDGEERVVESNPTAEVSLALEVNAETETVNVLTNEVAPQEDTGVEAVQEMPFPIEIDSATPVEEPLPTEIDEPDTSGEAHSEEKEAEAAASSEVPLLDAVNVESEVPVEEKLTSAAVESVEESSVVAGAPEESASEKRSWQEDAEPTPAQDQKPQRKRSFWEFLLGLPGH